MASDAGESLRFDARGASLHYRRWSKGRGPLVVLVHGFRGHSHWWDWVAPALAEDFDIVALDLSGMGDSDRRARYTRKSFALDIIDLLDHLGETAVVIGHSFGGTSLLYASILDRVNNRRPMIERAIVIDSWVRFPVDPKYVPGQLGRGRTYETREAAKRRFRLVPEQPVMDPAMLEHMAEHSVRSDHDLWGWKFDPDIPEIAPLHDGRKILRRVFTPTVIVYGEASSTVTRERAERCVAELPNASGPIEIPQAHHHMMFDQPIALIALLRALLKTQVNDHSVGS